MRVGAHSAEYSLRIGCIGRAKYRWSRTKKGLAVRLPDFVKLQLARSGDMLARLLCARDKVSSLVSLVSYILPRLLSWAGVVAMVLGESGEKKAGDFLLLSIAANLKVLLFGPLVAGALALALAFVWPKTYTSQAYLTLGDQEVKAIETIIRSPAVLDVLLSRFPTRYGVTDAGREELSSRIRFVGGVGQKPGTVVVKLEVDEDSPERAQNLANALIDSWLETTKPKPVGKQELERRLKLTQDALADVSRIIARFTSEVPKLVMPNLQYDLAQPTTQLLRMRNDYVDAIASMELTLKGRSRDVVASAPTLPDRPSKPKKAFIAVLVTLFTGGALLGWIVLRSWWLAALQEAGFSASWSRVKSTLRAL